MRHFQSIGLVALLASLPATAAARPDAKPLTAVEYRLDGKIILVPVSINDAPVEWFCVDTATTHSVIDPRLSAKLKLSATGTGTTTGSGLGDVGIVRLAPVAMKLGSVSIAVAEPWQVDLKDVPIAQDTRGLVGSELFTSHVVRIDPAKRQLSLFDPKGFDHGGDGAVLPLIVRDGKMYIDVTMDVKPGRSVTHRLEISTGSEESVNDPVVADAAVTMTTVLGNGLGKNYEAVSGQLEAVHIGPYTISKVWGPGGHTPSIGMEMFRRFVATFDVPNGKLHLQPTAAFSEPVPPPR